VSVAFSSAASSTDGVDAGAAAVKAQTIDVF
jgi:hypothetical protein